MRPAVFRRIPLIIAVVYAVSSAVWIAFSDRALSWWVAAGPVQYERLQTLKGWAFVLATAAGMHLGLRYLLRRYLRTYDAARFSEERLDLALSSAGAGIWDIDLRDTRRTFASSQMKRIINWPADRPLILDDWNRQIHPDDIDEANRKGRAAFEGPAGPDYEARYRIFTTDGVMRWIHSRGRAIHDHAGRPLRMIGVATDVTEAMQTEERIAKAAQYDPLTGLANRGKFLSGLTDLVQTVPPRAVFAVAKFRIEDFRELESELGAADTDALILTLSERLKAGLERGALVARLAPDLFAVATEPVEERDLAVEAVARLAGCFVQGAIVNGRSTQIALAAGASLYPRDGLTAEDLMANTGRALEKHDPASASEIQWFTEEFGAEFRQRAKRIRDLRSAVARGQIECHLQPVIGLNDGRVMGFEALARWRHPEEGLLVPAQFIDIAEEYGQIAGIGAEMLLQACTHAASFASDTPIFVAVNVSTRQLRDPDFPGVVERILADTGLDPSRLELEVTESSLVDDFEAAERRLSRLRQIGVSIAIDDFGTKYSSLLTLSRLPFNRLKIDKSFVDEMLLRREVRLIVSSIISLCRGLNLSVTAEGVQLPAQIGYLRSLGVQSAQGYYFSPPVPMHNAALLIDRVWSIGETPQRADTAFRAHS